MIIRIIVASCLLMSISSTGFSETDQYINTKVYVPESRLAKIFEIPEGELFIVRGNVRRMDNFVELWARIILRNHEQQTLDLWRSEDVTVDQKSDYAHLKVHFYCRNDEAAIPAIYFFNKWSELIDSRVVMIDETFSTKNRPVMNRLRELACDGKLDKY